MFNWVVIMQGNINILETERRKTVIELSNLFHVIQEIGQRLSDETHGESYDKVRQLNQLLHDVRLQINIIKAEVEGI